MAFYHLLLFDRTAFLRCGGARRESRDGTAYNPITQEQELTLKGCNRSSSVFQWKLSHQRNVGFGGGGDRGNLKQFKILNNLNPNAIYGFNFSCIDCFSSISLLLVFLEISIRI